MTKKKLALIVIPCATLFMAAAVFFALWLSQGKIDYAAAANNVAEITSHESAITDYIDTTSSFNFENIDRDALSRLQNATTQIQSYFESLSASTAQNDPEVSRRHADLAPFVAKLVEISTASTQLVAYIDKVNQSGPNAAQNELDLLRGSQNTSIAKLGTDLHDYFTAAAQFNEKYQSGKTDDYNAMIAAYSQLTLAGKALTAKYAALTTEEIFDLNLESAQQNFIKFQELESYLRAKI